MNYSLVRRVTAGACCAVTDLHAYCFLLIDMCYSFLSFKFAVPMTFHKGQGQTISTNTSVYWRPVIAVLSVKQTPKLEPVLFPTDRQTRIRSVCQSCLTLVHYKDMHFFLTTILSHWDISHGKFGLLSPGEATCNRVALPQPRYILSVLFP